MRRDKSTEFSEEMRIFMVGRLCVTCMFIVDYRSIGIQISK